MTIVSLSQSKRAGFKIHDLAPLQLFFPARTCAKSRALWWRMELSLGHGSCLRCSDSLAMFVNLADGLYWKPDNEARPNCQNAINRFAERIFQKVQSNQWPLTPLRGVPFTDV